MTEEEYFRKNYPDSCYGDKPLSPHWDFFQDGVEFGERDSEKRIEELEKENADLQKSHQDLYNSMRVIKDQRNKAKEHIENLLYYVKQCTCERSNYAEIEKDIKEAEQFLKELDNDKEKRS